MVGTLIRLLVAAALGAGAIPLCWLLVEWSARKVFWPPPDAIATCSGAALGLLLVLWRKPNWFWHTAVHEITHLLTCWCLGVRVSGISITDGKGGAVEHVETGPIRGTLIAIAPYTIPLVLLPFLAVRHLIITEPDGWRQAMSALCALLSMTHLQGLFHNVRINFSGDQADLVKVGRPLSLVLIAISLLLIAAWVMRALWTGAGSGY